jgi:hypothetical protein
MKSKYERLLARNRRLAYKIKAQAAQIDDLVIVLTGKLNPIGSAPKDGEWILVFDIDTGKAYVVRYDNDNDHWEAMIGGWFETDEIRGWMSIPDSCQVEQPYRQLLEGK